MYKTFSVLPVFVFLSNASINPNGPTIITDCTKCLSKIIQNEFTKFGLIIFTNTHNASTSVLSIRTQILKSIHQEIKFTIEVMSPYREKEVCNQDITELGVLHVDPYQALPSADYYVIIIESYQDFSSLAGKIIRSRTWNPYAKFLILLLNFVSSLKVNIEDIEKILTCAFKFNVVSIIVALPQTRNLRTTIIYSWKPFDPPKYCGNYNETAKDRLIEVNVCENGVLKYKRSVFENKIPRDMSGCVLNILALPRQPYISRNENDSDMEKILADRILKTFNMVPNFTLINDVRGERYRNGQWSGGLKKLVKKKGHILLGGIYPDFDIHEDFECSITYLFDAYTWVVPRASKMPPWAALLNIFEVFVWYTAIAGFLLCAVSWTVIGKLCGDSPYNSLFDHCILNTWISVMGFVAYKRPVKESLRIFFVFLNLYSLLFLTAYQTKLFDTLTNPSYEYQIKTVEELINSGLKFGGYEELHDLFVNSTDPLDSYIAAQWVDIRNVTAAMLDIAIHKNYSVLCSRLQLGHFSAVLPQLSDDYGNYKYYAFDGNMFSVPVEMIALKGFPFMHDFSNTITLFKQSGLNEALKNQYADFNERRRAKLLRDEKPRRHNVSQLSAQHLQGGFLALAAGYFGGSIVFIIEVVVNSNYVQKKVTNIIFRGS